MSAYVWAISPYEYPCLTLQCRNILESPSGWISDTIVNATVFIEATVWHTRLAKFFTRIHRSFEVIGGRKEFIQVLHSNKDHWLTISTIDCYPVVKVYDSMNTAIPLSTKQQICSIFMPTERLISLEFVAVDRQNNSNDCGVFALAFATALCAGEDPQYLHFNTEGTSMRDHLLQCLENGAIQPFPSEMLKRRRARRDMKNDKIEVFCTCRSTEDKDMLECGKCGEMFHGAVHKLRHTN